MEFFCKSYKPIKFLSLPLNSYHKLNLFRLESATQSEISFYYIHCLSVKKNHGNKSSPVIFDGIILLNDWAKSSRIFVEWADQYRIPTYAIVEGVNDFNDADTGRKRKAYRRVKNLFLNGEFDRKYFKDFPGKLYIGGIDRLDELYEDIQSQPLQSKSRKVVINCNFTYGVLVDHSKGWLLQVVNACINNDLNYIISKHPADKTLVYPFNLTARKLVDELKESEIFVTRFSGAVFEALVAGCKVIYFNPGIENVDKFNDPLGAYLYARSEFELDSAITQIINGWQPDVASFLQLHADFSFDRREPNDLSINKVAKVLMQDYKNNRWRRIWHHLSLRFRSRKILEDLSRRLNILSERKYSTIKSAADELEVARTLFNGGSYCSASVVYSLLNQLSQRGIYDANIELCFRRMLHDNPSPDLISIFKTAGIEKVYVLNLRRRPDRKLRAGIEFSRQGILPVFIEAIDADNSIAVNQFYEEHLSNSRLKNNLNAHLTETQEKLIQNSLSKGAVAYKISQQLIFEDAISNGYKRIAVFDDDVFFSKYAAITLGGVLDRNKGNWRIIALGSSDYSLENLLVNTEAIAETEIAGHYKPIPGKTCGSFAMFYDCSVFSELIEGCKLPYGTFDNTVLGSIYAKYSSESSVLFPNVAIPNVEDSDIRSSRAQIGQSKRMFWDLTGFQRQLADVDVFIICKEPGDNQAFMRSLASFEALNIIFLTASEAIKILNADDFIICTSLLELSHEYNIYDLMCAALPASSPKSAYRFFFYIGS